MRMALTDDIARLTSVMVREHVADGRAGQLRVAGRMSHSELGKVCGVSGALVQEWERGTLHPTTAQGLQWLDALYGAQWRYRDRGMS